MILGNTDIDIMTVRNILGYPSTDLGTLCSCDNVNKYSRYRPGYWATDGSKTLVFKKPLGGNYSDPRGTDTEIGSNLQLYKLGDFRGYNSTARAPFYDGDNPRKINVASTYSGSTISEPVVIQLGEVDWFNTETNYWGKNANFNCSQLVAVNGDGTVIGYMDYANLQNDGRNKAAEFNVDVAVPTSSGYSTTTTIRVGLGKANKLYYYLPTESNLTITVTKSGNPSYNISIDESCASTIYSRIAGQLEETDTNVYDIILSPSSGTFTTGATSLNFSTTDAIIVGYPSYNQFRIISPKLTLSYTVSVYTKPQNGSLVNSWSTSSTFAFGGSGIYRIQIPLNTKALDNYYYDIKITDIGTTTRVERV